MSGCSHWGLDGPSFVVLGLCPPQCCSTQYRNMRYLMVGFPSVSASSGFHDVLKGRYLHLNRQPPPFKSQTEHGDFRHVYTERRGYIHCSSNARGDFYGTLGDRFTLLSLAQKEKWTSERIGQHSRGQLLALYILFRLKMVVIIKSCWLHEKVLWIKNIQILLTSSTGAQLSLQLFPRSSRIKSMDDFHIYVKHQYCLTVVITSPLEMMRSADHRVK